MSLPKKPIQHFYKSSIKINKIMKNNLLKAASYAALFFGVTTLQAQQNPVTALSNTAVSKYNYHDTFGPNFYTKNGTDSRSASGQPGAKYWQNKPIINYQPH